MASLNIILITTVLVLASSIAGSASEDKLLHYILEPHKLELVCNLKNATSVKWEKGSQIIQMGHGFTQTTSGDSTKSILTKTNTSITDAGQYRCVSGDGKESKTFTVKVFKVITHDITIVSKEPAMIKCDLQSTDKDLKVQNFYWTKNHTALDKVPEIQGRYKEDLENYTLEIPKSKRRDNGVYNCVFKINDQEFSINVHMNMAPWIESMEKSRNLVQGDKLHLECNVVSHPLASVLWKKDNETFKNTVVNRVFMNGNRTLIIYDLQFSDRGDYTCVATNSVNSTSMTVLVRVKDKLAALWPFLGIVAEVVILCIIIFICEKRRSKEMEDEYENAGPQSMPNAKDHKGKDEIRQRNVRT